MTIGSARKKIFRKSFLRDTRRRRHTANPPKGKEAFIPGHGGSGDSISPPDRDLNLVHVCRSFEDFCQVVKSDGTVCFVHAEHPGIMTGKELSVVTPLTLLDMREWKKSERALRDSEKKFRALTEMSSALHWLYQDERVMYVNASGARLTGYEIDEIYRMRFWDVIHPEDRQMVRERGLARQRGEPVPTKYEARLLTKSGETKWIEITANRIEYQGKPAALATLFDITERKKAEEALRESEERLQLCATTARFGTFDWDIINDRHIWSPETYEIYGLPRDTLLTLDSMSKCIYPGDRQDDVLAAGLDPSGPGEYSMEYRIIRASDGAIRWVYVRTRIIFSGDGADRRAVRALGAIQDITDRIRTEDGLRAAKSQAELYLDLMGHDINNMHQIALGYLELAREAGQIDEFGKEYLDRSMEVLQRCTQLIGNVRKMQKLLDGSLNTRMIDIGNVLTDVHRELDAVPNKPVRLNLNCTGQCNVQANDLLYDAFSNLVTNAIKHTGDRADITISLEKVVENDCQYYRVSVEDNGPGITDDMKYLIFNRMLKGNTRAKGMGLGLYLARSLIDSYDGLLWVEDRVPGDHTGGARFVVMLPAAE